MATRGAFGHATRTTFNLQTLALAYWPRGARLATLREQPSNLQPLKILHFAHTPQY
ncbi:MAG: hypothetical protein F6J98_32750 [Moorea sp. SIO4G2]|uniref:hypothetical protein n=1 Tax=Moorena sp. SIO3E8 TaxID=2607830 RepID=UPI0013F8B503|nr:hypothetical protein [Moorena sp. SIO3E8]NEO14105.1 hypothetical protein [Moorena sp. SIO3E8]NEO64911.1 hypothetical protein [Moorena sp. SIO4G2]